MHSPFFKTISCLLLLSIIAPAVLADGGVKDDGKFFSTSAVDTANKELTRTYREFGKELVIETFATVPDDRGANLDSLKSDVKARNEFFRKWSVQRAEDRMVNGVYVLICRTPSHLEVRAGEETKKRGEFTQSDQDALKLILLTSLKEKSDDDGLQKAVRYFSDALKRNGVHKGGAVMRPEAPRNTPSSPVPTKGSSGLFSGSCMWIVLVVIAAIVIVRVLGSLTGRSGGGNNSGQGNSGGGNFGPRG